MTKHNKRQMLNFISNLARQSYKKRAWVLTAVSAVMIFVSTVAPRG